MIQIPPITQIPHCTNAISLFSMVPYTINRQTLVKSSKHINFGKIVQLSEQTNLQTFITLGGALAFVHTLCSEHTEHFEYKGEWVYL